MIGKLLRNKLVMINVVNVFFSFHSFLLIYVNSTFLDRFFSADGVSLLYVIGAALSVLLLFHASRLISIFGVRTLILTSLLFELGAVLALTVTTIPVGIIFFFVIYQGLFRTIVFYFDLVLEEYSDDETKTGAVRSLFLTVSNTALVLSPFLAGQIIGVAGNYEVLYAVSALLVIPAILFTLYLLRDFKEPVLPNISFFKAGKQVFQSRDLCNIFVAQSLLRLFYAWMVIYMPIYLFSTVGLTWPEIGTVFTVMLLPFVFFEIPAGKAADMWLGEKELLIAGFIIMGGATLLIPFITSSALVVWAIILFLTRAGASVVEIMTESYFFKHVNHNNADAIGFYRTSWPLAYVITPLIATVLIGTIGLGNSFFILGLFVFVGVFSSLRITDTR